MPANDYVIERGDLISGREGRLFLIVDGVQHNLAWFKNVTATLSRRKKNLPRLGSRTDVHMSTNGEIKGEGEMYDGTPLLRQIAERYVKTGEDVYAEMLIINDDPSSGRGRQTLQLHKVNFDDIVLAALDITSDDALSVKVSFTADGFEYLSHFNNGPSTAVE